MQAETALAIAQDLAIGTPEALERVKVSAKAAYDKATAELATKVAAAETLTA